ncbi:MAG: hypothetical protein NVS1B4_21200 [Gemmatimonadaceae bacterium]
MTGRGRIGRYAVYQARDFLVDRGIALCIIATFLIISLISGLRAIGPSGWYRSADGDALQLVRQAVAAIVPRFSDIVTLVAINAIISSDRKLGYYRLLFAKPVSIRRYYAQAFVLHGTGAVAAALAFSLLVALTTRPMLVAGTVVAVAVQFILFGGIGFLLSSLLNTDWLWLSATYAVTLLLKTFYEVGDGPRALILRSILPPVQVMYGVRGAVLQSDSGAVPSVDPWHLLWLVAYGLGAFALGLVVLRRRPLGR